MIILIFSIDSDFTSEMILGIKGEIVRYLFLNRTGRFSSSRSFVMGGKVKGKSVLNNL